MNIASILAQKGSKVATCRPEQSIREALALLAEHNIGALVVVDETSVPAGMLSERDIVREAARDERLFARTIGEIMTKDVIVGVPEDDLRAVRRTMTERRIRHVPVIAEGRLIGIVSIGDVVKAELDQYLGEVDTLQMQVGVRP
jgi:CBS domain-containing protein